MNARSTMSEQELIIQLKMNKREAFEYLYDHYSSPLYGIVLKILKDEDKAADSLQDTFVKIWKNIAAYNREKGTLFTWILNIARNTAIDKLRGEVKTSEVVKWDQVKDSELTPTAVFDPSPATMDLRAIVAGMLPERRQLIEMVYFEGYTQEEASVRLQLPLGTVKSRIRRALQELRGTFMIEHLQVA